MNAKEEYAMGGETKEYCIFCSRPDGTMQSYNQKPESMTVFIQNRQGPNETAAKEIAKGMMPTLAAWRSENQNQERWLLPALPYSQTWLEQS